MADVGEPVRMRMQCRDGTYGWFVISAGHAMYAGPAEPEPSSGRDDLRSELIVQCADEIARLEGLVARALPLVAHAVDVPRREVEAQRWLADAQEALKRS